MADQPDRQQIDSLAGIHHGGPVDNASLRSGMDIVEEVDVEQITFNQLPPEIISQVFAILTLVERIPLEAVCTRWKSVIRNIRDQKVIILSNTRLRKKYHYHFNNRYHSDHCWNDRLHKVVVSSTKQITSVLKRCPGLIAIDIDFEPDFQFSQRQLALDLNWLRPKLEHLRWHGKGSKKDFLIELGEFDNLSCWHVDIDDDDSDDAIRVLARQPNLRLKSLIFGKGISRVLPLTDPAILEHLYSCQDEDEMININRFHRLKVFYCYRTTLHNYQHLQTLTTLSLLQVYDNEHILSEAILECIVKNNKELGYLDTLLHEDVRGVPLIAKYSKKIRSLDIRTAPSYYHQEDWVALSNLQKLNALSFYGISKSHADMNGIALVLKNCSSINELSCSHEQDKELEEEAIISS